MNTLLEISNILKEKDFFFILTHIYPDGDALGSATALCRTLQRCGKHAKILYNNTVPEKFQYLTKFITEENFIPEYIISVDLADTALLGANLEQYKNKIDMCIDHHLSNKNYATINFVDSNAAANCEIIYKLLNEMNIIPDPETASALYTGIATDTGCFLYSNTTSDTHLIASKLTELGASIQEINENLFMIKTFKKIKLERILYENLEFKFDSKCAITHIGINEMNKIGITDSELDGIASIPIIIKGVKIGITLREKAENQFKVSVRTSSDINADYFCKNFGGGGHAKAGGFNISGNITKVKEIISDKIKSTMEW